MRWADCMGHPSGAALKAAGFGGIFLYVGTPGRAKNATGAIYRDYLLAGLQIACVYENGIDDISSGAGAAHAQAAVSDMRAMGIPDSMPLAAAADEHLTAGQIPTAVSYQAQFHAAAQDAGWTGPIGGYGFSEFTHAVSIAGVAEWLWQCGSTSMLWSGVTFWQRNDGTMTVAGTQVDINEQYNPLPAVGGGTTGGGAVPASGVIPMEETMTDVPAGNGVKTRLFAAGRPHYLWIYVTDGHKVTIKDVAYVKRTPDNDPKPAYGPLGQPGYPDLRGWVIDADRPGPFKFADDVAFVRLITDSDTDFTAAIG